MFEQIGNALFAIGISYLIALFIGRFVSRIQLPRVTGYIIVGLLAGPSLAELIGVRGLIDWETLESITILSELALALIMVIIGSQFRMETLRRWGKRLAILSAAEIFITFLLVFVAIFLSDYLVLKHTIGSELGLLGSSLYIALFTGIISIAGAPAATLLVIREYESDGPVTELIFALLGLNNLISIILFNIVSFILLDTSGSMWGILHSLFSPISVGFIVGLVVSFWAQKFEKSVDMQLLLVGAIIANVGAFHLWSIDFFLSCFVMGMVIVNASPKATRLFAALKGIDYPLYVIFFIITGASLHIDALGHIGLLGLAYIVMRAIGKVLGSWMGAKIADFGDVERRWLGYALLAQAGVAIGLAQALATAWPESGVLVQTVILGSVVVFELVGPIAVRHALVHAGEVPVLTLYAKSSPDTALEGMAHVIRHFQRSLGLPQDHKVESAADILVEHVMRRNVETIKEDMAFNEILKYISHSKYDRFPITDRDNNFIGVIDYEDIRDVLVDDILSQIVVAKDLMKPEPLTVKPRHKLGQVLELFREHSNMTYLPVITCDEERTLAGIIRQNDVLATFHIPNLKS